MIFGEPLQLAAEIRRLVGVGGIIGVDGWLGAGKSFLAEALAASTQGEAVDLDVYLETNRNCYVAALRLEEISSRLSGGGLLFVSGICLRHVLHLIGVEAKAHVYIKRMASWGWADEEEISGALLEFPNSSGVKLREELRQYHAEWQPHTKADFEYQRFT